MAEKLRVSRPSVREAYCVLEMVGILESKVGSGTFVKSGNIDQISINKIKDIATEEESPFEIIEVRKIIEPEIVAMAVKNAVPEDIKEIEKLLDMMKSEVESSGGYSVETDARFHIRVAQASGNAVFFNIMKYIMVLLRERLWDFIIDGPLANSEDLKKDLEFHENILRCIKENDQKSVRPNMLRRFNEIQKMIEQ
ncbi:MAG TPA: FadR family transcriptional regulator [Spirochaetes bacterium]|nr:FadR family transcriptional regulator [Spirochaetota bacterium]